MSKLNKYENLNREIIKEVIKGLVRLKATKNLRIYFKEISLNYEIGDPSCCTKN